MIVVVTETPGATDKLPKHDISDGVATPPLGIAALDLLSLVPALLLHAVREAPRVRILRCGRWFVDRDLEAFDEKGSVL